MNGRLLVIGSLACIVLAGPTSALVPSGVPLFFDEFLGSELSPAWIADAHTGRVGVANGRLTLYGGTYYPLVKSALPIVPPVAPLEVEFRFRYLVHTQYGTGFGVGSWASVWIDSRGLYVNLQGTSVVVPTDPLREHVVVFERDVDGYRVTFDGTLVQAAPNEAPLSLESVALWIGNRDECCPGVRYSTVSVDRVEVRVP